MLSSLRISSRRASTPASPYVITRPWSDILSPQLKHVLVDGVRRRFRAFLGEFDRLVDKPLYFLIGRLNVFFIHTHVEQSLASQFHGVSLFPLLNFLTGSIVCTGVAFVMADITISFALDQSGAAIVASPLDRCFRGFMHRNYILAVDLDAQHSIRRCTTGHARILGSPLKGHFRRVQVVLAHINDRQVPNSTEIDGLMKRTAVDRAIAKEADDNLGFLS